MRRPLVILSILAALLASCADGDSSGTTATPPTDDLIVYSGRNENFVSPVVEAFTEATGIEVRVRYGDGTSDLAATLLNEGDTTDADVFWAQDPAWIGVIGEEGLLTELPTDILGLVSDAYQDANGEWVGVTARSRVLVYNPDLVSEDELPESVFELVDPEWSGRLGIAPGNASFIAFVSAMELVEGPEATLAWLEGMASNDVRTYDGNGPIVDAVIAGDLDAGLVNHYYLLQRIADQGEVSARNHFFAPGDTGSLVMATGAGVLSASDNREAADEFIRHLLSPESQEHFSVNLFEYGLVDGAPTPQGQLPLSDLAGPDINLTDLADHLDSSVDLIAEAGLS